MEREERAADDELAAHLEGRRDDGDRPLRAARGDGAREVAVAIVDDDERAGVGSVGERGGGLGDGIVRAERGGVCLLYTSDAVDE